MAKNGRPYTLLQFILFYGTDDWPAKWQECETKQRVESPKITDRELRQSRIVQVVVVTQFSFPRRGGPFDNR